MVVGSQHVSVMVGIVDDVETTKPSKTKRKLYVENADQEVVTGRSGMGCVESNLFPGTLFRAFGPRFHGLARVWGSACWCWVHGAVARSSDGGCCGIGWMGWMGWRGRSVHGCLHACMDTVLSLPDIEYILSSM